MSPTVSSELERICDCGRSRRATILGLFGSVTSTAVKFFGALSCASHRMRRPSFVSCIDMPSPIPPNPSSELCETSLKFQIIELSVAGMVPPKEQWLRGFWHLWVGVVAQRVVERRVGQLRNRADRGARHPPYRVVGVGGEERDRVGGWAGRRVARIGDRDLPARPGVAARLQLDAAPGQMNAGDAFAAG